MTAEQGADFWISNATLAQLEAKRDEYQGKIFQGGRDIENASRLIRKLTTEIRERCVTA